MSSALHVIMYHYVRDLPNTRFPRIKGMLTREFRHQVASLQRHYQMATLESAMDFLSGNYTPERDMCLLTFDDGLKEHYCEVTPLLMDRGIQGLFFIITSCLEGNYVAPVHMNQFLSATLEFEEYRDVFLARLASISPELSHTAPVESSVARRLYRWDTAEVAGFKYFFNFLLNCDVRNQVLKDLFEETIGDVESFARELYLTASEAREMQREGMIVGGHSHRHRPLSALSEEELASDLHLCHRILTTNLAPQPLWPFCYPYGKQGSFNSSALTELKQLGFACSFSTEIGSNAPGADTFIIRRLDCKDIRLQ
jgi:peptidoglycan/xylan/chitin deacetylase (PgdA/CDA1 family)